MQIDLGYGQVFFGSPLAIVIQMKSAAEGVEDLDLHGYIDWVIDRARVIEGALLRVGPGPLSARADRLLREVIRARLARQIEEEAEPLSAA